MQEVDRQVLLPTLIDERARLEPDRLYCAFLETSTSEGLRRVTYKEFANAVNKCAWWLEDQIGLGNAFQTVAYYGPSDIRPAIFTLAAAKTNYKAFLASPRNSVAAQLKLLEETSCRVLLVAEDFPIFNPVAAALAKKRDVQILKFDILNHWLEASEVPLYPCTANLSDNPQRPYVVFHTSGSTGLPKPITYTFSALVSYITQANPTLVLPDCPLTQTDALKDKCHYVGLPTFHMVGLICLTAVAVYWSMPPILGPSTSIPNADIATRIHADQLCEGSTLPPSVLEDIAADSAMLAMLKKLKFVNWIGGPLSSPTVASAVSAHVPIYCAYGATESGNMPLLLTPGESEYMGFSSLVGASFRPYIASASQYQSAEADEKDKLYELVLVRDEKVLPAQLIFLNNPGMTEYATRDLFSQHPTRPGFWRYRGRTDDIINTAHGQLIDPAAMENIVNGNPRVVSALLIGMGKRETAWLVEARQPPEGEAEEAELRDQLWKAVQEANEVGPVFAKARKAAVIFTTKDRPMLRAGKGTVQRHLTLQSYEEEIQQLYSSL